MRALDHRSLFAWDLALINPLQVGSSLWNDLPTVPLVPEEVEPQQQLMPRLLDLRDLSDTLRVSLLGRSQRHRRASRHPYFSALLRSEATTREVSAHLVRQLLVSAPDGSRALLRFYDPRVFRHLCWLLDGAQLSTLLGRIDAWCWCGGPAHWRTHQREGAATSLRLRLQPRQWETLRRLDLLNKSLQQIERITPALAVDDAVAQRTDALLATAYREYGLADPADRCLFAVQATVFHPGIHSHPQLASRLVRARDAATSYVGACADLDDSTLRELASELAPPSRMLA